jgi:hypothetical protein
MNKQETISRVEKKPIVEKFKKLREESASVILIDKDGKQTKIKI